MDTWSSVAALVDRESIEEGWQSTLFSETEGGNVSVLVNRQHDFSTVVKIKLSTIWLYASELCDANQELRQCSVRS